MESARLICFIAVLSSLGNILLGYDIGIMSVAQVYIQRSLDLTDLQTGVQVGCLNFAGGIGGLLTGTLADHYGRKGTMIFAAVLFFSGALLCSCAMSFFLLFFGRIITGIGTGIGALCSPLLLTELVPPEQRGKLVGYTEVINNVGIFLGFVIGYLLCDLPGAWNWRLMLGLGAVPPFFIAFALHFIPESPRWLAMQGRVEDAQEVVNRVAEPAQRGAMMADVKLATSQEYAPWSEIFCPGSLLRKIIWIGWGVPLLSQATGTEAAVYFSPEIMRNAGIDSDEDTFRMNIVVGFVKASLLVIPMLYLDSFGRRPILMFALAGQGVSACFLALVLGHSGTPLFLPLLALCLYIGTFSLGLSTLAFVIPAEVFPLRYRARCTGVAWCLNRFMSSFVATTFLSFSNVLGQAGVFYLYSTVAFLGLLYACSYVPETSNVSLEEIQGLFEKGEGTNA